ncbi:MAG TPA: hypothetical protein VGE02_01905 [Gemmatimonadales bacterium]
MPSRPLLLSLAALALPAIAAPLLAQVGGVTARAADPTAPVVTTSSPATDAFVSGVQDAAYVFGARAAQRFGQALALDSTFGLARVFHAAFAPQLDQAQRDSAAARGVADAERGSASELVLATAMRELVANHPEAAQPLFDSLARMHPDNALYAMWSATDWAGTRPPAAVAEAFREVTQRFPSYGAPYNTLAYSLVQAGDTAGAIAAAARQVELAQMHPNPHDSYAEILQFAGRLDEAATHYANATAREPSYTEGYVGVAEVRQLQGRGDDARTALNEAIRNALSLQDSLRYMRYLAQSEAADGRDEQAAARLAEVARLAESRGVAATAAGVHRDLALLEALDGDERGVAQHLAEARADAPDTPAQATQQADVAALAYFVAGDADSLRAAAAGRDSVHLVQTMVLIGGGRGEDALTSLARADTTQPIAQELSAEAHALLGHADIARASRARLLARRDALYFNAPDLRNVVALRRAKM